ncbi:MAG: hypothetical protein HYS70_01225 [Nitrospinae bacterium]|nr:hypothetical protein [Nitrospinota bacterium]
MWREKHGNGSRRDQKYRPEAAFLIAHPRDLVKFPLLLCPLHADRNPSLNPAYTGADGRQRWHCYGCGAGGDAIDLVQAVARLGGVELSFPGALGQLSELTGIEVEGQERSGAGTHLLRSLPGPQGSSGSG